MNGVRPADFPPPFANAEAIGTLTDAPDERIDVRDLDLATDCYRWVAPRLLGGEDPRP